MNCFPSGLELEAGFKNVPQGMTGKDHTFDFITVGALTYHLYLFRESDVYVSQAEGVPVLGGLLHL